MKVTQKMRHILLSLAGAWYAPTDRRNSDVYLVEYPRSGMTWASTVMANVNFGMLGLPLQASHYNVGIHVPAILGPRRIGPQVSEALGFRLMRSHSEYNPHYRFVVYMLRSPFDGAVSHWHYQRHNGYDGTLMDFVKHPKWGVEAWRRHVRSWLIRPQQDDRVHMIRYEDLRANTEEEMRNLYVNLCGVSPGEAVSQAVEKASFERMQESQECFRLHNPKYTRQFVRKGGTSYEMPDEVRAYISRIAATELEKFYPDLGASPARPGSG